MLRTFKFILYWFSHASDALFNASLPWRYRWRLLALQPLTLLTYSIKFFPYLFSNRYTVMEMPTRGKHSIRTLIFRPPRRDDAKIHPLHIDFHGGGFLGGIAEYDAPFCELLSDRAGMVVVSAQYRTAPACMYPCAHEDAEDVIDWVLKNASRLWNANPDSLTVSGFSAGGNLMFRAGTRAKAAVGFYSVVDFRIPPWQKPKPENFPSTNPLFWLDPLFDAYAGGSESLQQLRKCDAMLSPILKPLDQLPRNILLVIAGVDILAAEQRNFIDRLDAEKEKSRIDRDRQFESIVFKNGFHGWLELPASVVGEQGERDRIKAFDAAIKFLTDADKEQPAASRVNSAGDFFD